MVKKVKECGREKERRRVEGRKYGRGRKMKIKYINNELLKLKTEAESRKTKERKERKDERSYNEDGPAKQ